MRTVTSPAVRILRLSNSDDFTPHLPVAERLPAVAERTFRELAGCAVETEVRIIWPGAELPDLVDRWLSRHEPDAVLLVVSSFWFTYQTVEVRLRQRFGRAGAPLAGAVQSAVTRPWLSELRAFRAARGLALRTIGGAPYFTPAQVIDTAEACIRRVLQHEHIALAVRGPLSLFPQPSAGLLRERDGLLLEVDAALGAFCAAREVTYVPAGPELARTEADDDYLPDGIHARPELHLRRGTLEGKALFVAWSKNRGPGG